MALISEITIKALRGCPDNSVGFGNRGLIILGENGSGKSSIVDGFEYFFTGDLMHISTVQSVPVSSLPTAGYSRDDISVTVSFEEGQNSYELTRNEGGISPIPGNLEQYINKAQELGTILRRKNILDFVRNIPSERYKVLAEIMGITSYRDKVLAVQQCRNGWQEKLERITCSKNRVLDELREEFDAIEESEIVDFLNDQLRNAISVEAEDINQILSCLDTWIAKNSTEAKMEECINTLSGVNSTLEEAAHSSGIIQEKKRELTDDTPSRIYMDLLAKGQSLMQDWDEEACPLCEQAIPKTSLVAKINRKLDQFKAITEKYEEIKEEEDNVLSKRDSIVSGITNAKGHLNGIADMEELTTALEEAAETSEEIIIPNKLDEILVFRTNLEKLRHSIKTREVDKEWSEQEDKVRELRQKTLSAKNLLTRLQRESKQHKKVTAAFRDADAIFQSFKKAGQNVVRQQIEPLLDDVNEYFGFIHPHDEHEDIDITLEPSRTASTRITLKSFGLDSTDPRAYSSEGHLDSLGLCIFLAFAKHFHKSCSLIILDDVVSSIDANHRQRIAKLLLEEFEGRQLLVTTHNRAWAKSLRSYIAAYELENEFRIDEIVKWTRENGPIFDSFKEDWDLVSHYMEQPSGHRAAANLTRQTLETILRKACDNLRVPLYYRDNERRRTLDYFLTGLENMIQDEFSNPGLGIQELLDELRDVRATSVWGHIGSHSSSLSDEISQGDVEDFIDAVKSLQSELICEHCSAPLEKRAGQTVMRCKNKTCPNPTELQ